MTFDTISEDPFLKLREFLDHFPIGYPKTSSGIEIKILKRLFSEQEAKIAVYLTPIPEKISRIARRAGLERKEVEEILDSMEKMARIKDDAREETKESFIKLNNMIKKLISEREDSDVLFVSYNDILTNPEENIHKIAEFIGYSEIDQDKMLASIDQKLYRNRKTVI